MTGEAQLPSEGTAGPLDGSPLDAFETPVGVIDVGRVRANARRAATYCARHGIRWRPHVKTHKSVDLARIQLEEGAHGELSTRLHYKSNAKDGVLLLVILTQTKTRLYHTEFNLRTLYRSTRLLSMQQHPRLMY